MSDDDLTRAIAKALRLYVVQGMVRPDLAERIAVRIAPLVEARVREARARELDDLAAEMASTEWHHLDSWGVSVIYPGALAKRAGEVRRGNA